MLKLKTMKQDIYLVCVQPVKKLVMYSVILIAAWLMSLVITLVVLLIWTLVMGMLGYQIITVSTIPLLLIYITLNSLSATSFTFFVVNFVKSVTAFSSVSTILRNANRIFSRNLFTY